MIELLPIITHIPLFWHSSIYFFYNLLPVLYNNEGQNIWKEMKLIVNV